MVVDGTGDSHRVGRIGGGSVESGVIRTENGHRVGEGPHPLVGGEGQSHGRVGSGDKSRDIRNREVRVIGGGNGLEVDPESARVGDRQVRGNRSAETDDRVTQGNRCVGKTSGSMIVNAGRYLDVGKAQVCAGTGKRGSVGEGHQGIGGEGSRTDAAGIQAGTQHRGTAGPQRGHVVEEAACIGGFQSHTESGSVAQGHAVGRGNHPRITGDPVGKHQIRGVHTTRSVVVDAGGYQECRRPVGGGSRHRTVIGERHGHIAVVGSGSLPTVADRHNAGGAGGQRSHIPHAQITIGIIGCLQRHAESPRITHRKRVGQAPVTNNRRTQVDPVRPEGSLRMIVDVLGHSQRVCADCGACSGQIGAVPVDDLDRVGVGTRPLPRRQGHHGRARESGGQVSDSG